MTSRKYATEWAAAVARTKRFGLDVPTHLIEPERRYLTDQRHAEFPKVIRRDLGDLNLSDLLMQCMSIHYRLLPVLEKWLECPVLYTIGWVDDGTDTGMFKFDDGFIADKLEKGHTGSTINIHAWLTLPSMEVIDLALTTALAHMHGLREGHGEAIAGHADELTNMTYKPMLVGHDFLRKTGLQV